VIHAGQAQELGHLGHVAEHVGQVAHLHGPAQGGGPPEPELQVADDRLPRDEELVHEDVPGAEGHPAGGVESAQGVGRLGPHGQVVIDHGHLPVEQEVAAGGVGLQRGQQSVEEVDEGQAEGREGGVPLAVPVGVGDDGDGAGRHRRIIAKILARRTGERGPVPSPGVCDCLVALAAATVAGRTLWANRRIIAGNPAQRARTGRRARPSASNGTRPDGTRDRSGPPT
jgi:hypothetical protein